MIFKSIRLKNFRQYKNDLTIRFFEPDNQKNMTILIAANGVGKTTLLQAFRYCFYGKSSNYLNLPRSDELVNNTLVDSLKELETEDMVVEISFNHLNTDYIARRKVTYKKIKGTLREETNESFELLQLIEKEGYKPIKGTESSDKIRAILPEGLSQVFMFDGERMERNISDKSFSSELKESILGILDIKKYDKLIEVIGNKGRVNSLLGMLHSRKKTFTPEQKAVKENYDSLLSQKEEKKQVIENIKESLVEIKNREEASKEEQRSREETKDSSIKIEKLNNKRNECIEKIDSISREFIKESKTALIYKTLLQLKDKYDCFVQSGKDNISFFPYLHLDTIEYIQKSKICICGRHVDEHSNECSYLEELKKTALPLESSQHLNMIEQKFKQSAAYEHRISELNTIRQNIRDQKNILQEINDSIYQEEQIVRDIEKRLGHFDQAKLEQLEIDKTNKNQELGAAQNELRLIENAINKLERKMSKIENNDEYNVKINHVIDIIQEVRDKLEKIKSVKEDEARYKLADYFNKSLKKTIHGNYSVEIDAKYHVKIIDNDTNKDVTNALNTGHNIVISLSFINALIETAKDMSGTIDSAEKYGVIMDAALSNLDEKHIYKLCKNTLSNLDQLIFLSFKRQLRDEMFHGIYDNIGLSYKMDKTKNGEVYIETIENEALSEYIHMSEED